MSTLRHCLLPLALTGLLSACQPQASTTALGTLERDRVLLTATAGEIIRALPVAEGSRVEEGTLLARLDDRRQQAVLARARAQQAQARAALARLTNGERPEDIAAARASLDKAQANVRESERNFERIDRLVRRKLVSPADLDKARAQRDRALAEQDGARQQLDKLARGVRREDIDEAQAALLAATAEVALAERELADLSIVATRSGRLDSLPYHLGERVAVGAVLAAIQADEAPYARVYVPEPSLAGYRVGQPVRVQVDGVAEPFAGRLRWISKEPAFTPYYALNEQDRARLVYLAEIDLPAGAQDLPSGLPLQAEPAAQGEGHE
ncbi:HlyD family secretion protein [Aeromonas hydrophila]|uniref:HlyD family secretion protein n=1 Tax=Aeromonas hydrophila TaxID=644 RepID=UPI00214EFF4F|nr:HlyD family efflux transporter periplasmic adaptor subunit [Aeromonas hydrophila]MCR3951774.1 HlyD family efflux transporter periplasmic adaptor subunit [Aeromonas hydrophila]MCW4614883.1 HlyD family efflux transporter periplasmic adaptor subunit [Aeromonas hydrophila]